MGGRIVALGECMVELAPAGEGLFRRSFAGDSYNFAWYLRRLLPSDRQVAYATAVGTDALSGEMLAAMAAAGIDTRSVRREADRTVGLYMIAIEDGERSFTYWRGQSAARRLAADPAWLDAQLEGAAVAFFSGITLAVVEPGHRDAFLGALSRARAAGTTVAFDPNARARLWPGVPEMADALEAAAAVADIVLPSVEDEATMTGSDDPDAAIARYRALGARLVVVKNGAGEVVAWEREAGRASLRPPEVEPVDTTAAGDSFNAGFLARHLFGAPLAACLAAGAAVAAEVIRHPGALVPEEAAAVLAEVAARDGTGRA